MQEREPGGAYKAFELYWEQGDGRTVATVVKMSTNARRSIYRGRPSFAGTSASMKKPLPCASFGSMHETAIRQPSICVMEPVHCRPTAHLDWKKVEKTSASEHDRVGPGGVRGEFACAILGVAYGLNPDIRFTDATCLLIAGNMEIQQAESLIIPKIKVANPSLFRAARQCAIQVPRHFQWPACWTAALRYLSPPWRS